MKTYILEKNQIDDFYRAAISGVENIIEAKMKVDLFGLEEIEVEEAKKKAKIGDCLVFEYDGKMVPFQVVDKNENGDCVLMSYYVLENRKFDDKTNKWKDSSLRKYMNGEMTKKFDKELVKIVKPRKVHTGDYVTEDKFWIPSHEEIGYKDDSGKFVKNEETKTFEMYLEKADDV